MPRMRPDEVRAEIYATMYKQIQMMIPERVRQQSEPALHPLLPFVADRFTDLTVAQRDFFVGILTSDRLDHQLMPGFVPTLQAIRSAIAESLRTADTSCLLQFQVIANGSTKGSSQIGECNFGTETGLLDVTASFVSVCRTRKRKIIS